MLSNFASLLLDYIDIPCFVDFLLQCWSLKKKQKKPEQNCVSSALRYGSECRSLAFPLCFQLRGFSSLHLIFSRIRLKTNLKGLRLFFPFSKGFMSQNANIKDSLVSSPPSPQGSTAALASVSEERSNLGSPRSWDVAASPSPGPHGSGAKARDHLMRVWPNESPAWG